MSLFPRNLYTADPSFTNLFRMLDDFDTYSREVQGNTGNESSGSRQRIQAVRSFNPKFDVRETEDAYELHGELAGLDKKDVSVEFTDPQTIVIRGRIERSYSAGTPPAGAVEGAKSGGAITENGEKHHESHKATVEDEAAEKAKEQGTQVVKSDKEQHARAPAEKYWVSERSIGEFSRTFGFPTRVDQDGVTANLNNGVLSVVVPKAKKHETRRISVL